MRHQIIFLAAILLVMDAAYGIGVSPSTIEVKDLTRGSVATAHAVISGFSGDFRIDAEGTAASWLSFEREEMEDGRVRIEVQISVPEDAENGLHDAQARIVEAAETNSITGNSIGVETGVKINFGLIVTGEQVRRYSIESMDIPRTAKGSPLILTMVVKNTGNVRSGPRRIDLRIIDPKTLNTIDEMTIEGDWTAEGHSTRTVRAQVEHDLETGRYIAEVGVDTSEMRKTEKIRFEIADQGLMVRRAEISGLFLRKDIEFGEIQKLSTIVKNTGELPVDATLVVETEKDGVLIDVSRSDPVEILPGQEKGVVSYYKPEERGAYRITAFVTYEGHDTDRIEQTYTISGGMPKGLLPAGIIGISIVLASLIWRKRR